MNQQTPDFEEADIIEDIPDNRRKKVVVYGEYDKHFHSPLRRKRIRISLMDILVGALILGILAFIGYRSLAIYGSQARDDIRIGHLALIREGLDTLIAEGKPLPEGYTAKNILVDGITIGSQGFAGEAFFTAIGKKLVKDPLDNTYYLYYYQPNSNQYEIMAFLENGQNQNNPTNKRGLLDTLGGLFVSESDYAHRTPYSIGSAGNILLSNLGASKGAPLNTLTTAEYIDLTNLTGLSDAYYLGASCRDILTRFPEYEGRDGNYLAFIGKRIKKVYCDMTTDGGGWTLFYANNGYPTSPIQESYVEMRDKMQKSGYELSDYTNLYLAGLLDTTHFTTNGAKEVLAKNRVGGAGKWVRFTFDTSETLAWALGKDILGKTNSGCYTLPNLGTWDITSNDGKIQYKNLIQMMNHGGTSWGVSHEKFACNNQPEGKTVSPHIAFYNANNHEVGNRARGNEGVGGKWGEGNEYRYFVR